MALLHNFCYRPILELLTKLNLTATLLVATVAEGSFSLCPIKVYGKKSRGLRAAQMPDLRSPIRLLRINKREYQGASRN